MKNQTRRTALKTIGASYAAVSLAGELFAGERISSKPIRLGVIADLHGGLAVDASARLDAFLKAVKDESVDAIVQMGDFAFPNKKHQSFADRFNAAHDNTVHVIGNHEFDFGLTRADCFKAWGIHSAYYGYDLKGLRILVLDGNEKGSPDYVSGYPSYVGKQQQQWLARELKLADQPVLILSHQPLAGRSAIDNASEIHELLARYRDKIVVCINGHSHVDSMLQVDGVTYLHINSASYYWVGGEKRMAYYEAPLFTTLTVDPANSIVFVEGKSTKWVTGDSPAEINYFDREHAPPETMVTPAIRARQIVGPVSTEKMTKTWPTGFGPTAQNRTQAQLFSDDRSTESLKVMTWNIWGRLNQDPRYTLKNKTARERMIEVVRESDADIVAMVETYGSAAEIAKALGFHYYTPGNQANLCIFSRYPLSDIEPLEGLSPFSFIAATVTLPGGQKIRVYDIWLTSSGRHLVEIKNQDLSDEEFCSGDDVRYDMLNTFLEHADLQRHLSNADEVPIVVAGDFNCVSHLDHSLATRHSKLNQSRVLPVKVSKAMLKAKFVDTFRESNPDVLESTLGHTWTTVGLGYEYVPERGFVPVEKNSAPEYRNPYARIDFIYAAGKKLQIRRSMVIAHHSSESKRSFPEFPSDHAAVLSEFRLETELGQ